MWQKNKKKTKQKSYLFSMSHVWQVLWFFSLRHLRKLHRQYRHSAAFFSLNESCWKVLHSELGTKFSTPFDECIFALGIHLRTRVQNGRVHSKKGVRKRLPGSSLKIAAAVEATQRRSRLWKKAKLISGRVYVSSGFFLRVASIIFLITSNFSGKNQERI